MGAKIQAFDIFQTPLSSHYPLPLRSPGIDSQPCGPVRQPYLTYWPARARIYKPIKEPRNRFRARRNQFPGIDSWALRRLQTRVVATQAAGMDSWAP
jgi:hypothetical protein